MSLDYQERAKTFRFASMEKIQAAATSPNVVFVDVRTMTEIQAQQFHLPTVHAPCTPTQCDVLEANAETILPSKDTPIIIFCRSGRRAAKAQETLERKGYTHVMNAGGIDDIPVLQTQ
mmetsp:Transcript_1621/g.2020  ORF Transcript_1621/g.2020 Transcript_1621/m.2020 type:complete len:118 (-) Transcript_1621:73-426(-)|eukprot:CAMPEP_0195246380 /NCGR_PEP_ID=MMETSP0706-20130129/369_1 /TAXON_ID=33640 /ORGANISM="Asterionellopsis glacialis, Strain CCMP134" /LENGTH=117 /DNA_ID=CAMNT_0040297747 /DNA_START=93 /DNA_END=446 /DNA_ORIENTATION=+